MPYLCLHIISCKHYLLSSGILDRLSYIMTLTSDYFSGNSFHFDSLAIPIIIPNKIIKTILFIINSTTLSYL